MYFSGLGARATKMLRGLPVLHPLPSILRGTAQSDRTAELYRPPTGRRVSAAWTLALREFSLPNDIS